MRRRNCFHCRELSFLIYFSNGRHFGRENTLKAFFRNQFYAISSLVNCKGRAHDVCGESESELQADPELNGSPIQTLAKSGNGEAN